MHRAFVSACASIVDLPTSRPSRAECGPRPRLRPRYKVTIITNQDQEMSATFRTFKEAERACRLAYKVSNFLEPFGEGFREVLIDDLRSLEEGQP